MNRKIQSNFVQAFGYTPINRLWEFLIDSRRLFDYSMTDICESADISWNTLKDGGSIEIEMKVIRDNTSVPMKLDIPKSALKPIASRK